MQKNLRLKRGFTLIELLVVIGVLAVLFAIVLIAINPARQFSQANNTKRASDVNTVLNAVHQYAADNKGALPAGIDTTIRTITDATDGANICAALVPKYVAALPVDPLTNNGTSVTDCTASYSANYQIVKSASDNRITISAPAAELSETISITR